MPPFFAQMGPWAYPMLLAALLLLVQIGRVAVGVGKGATTGGAPGTHSILVWGALSGVMGLLGTAMGISIAAGTIETATSISPPIVWGGIKVALSTTIFGFLLLALALVAWLAIRFMERRTRPASS